MTWIECTPNRSASMPKREANGLACSASAPSRPRPAPRTAAPPRRPMRRRARARSLRRRARRISPSEASTGVRRADPQARVHDLALCAGRRRHAWGSYPAQAVEHGDLGADGPPVKLERLLAAPLEVEVRIDPHRLSPRGAKTRGDPKISDRAPYCKRNRQLHVLAGGPGGSCPVRRRSECVRCAWSKKPASCTTSRTGTPRRSRLVAWRARSIWQKVRRVMPVSFRKCRCAVRRECARPPPCRPKSPRPRGRSR